MSRNKYDVAMGVTRVRWTYGDMSGEKYGVRLVETWAAGIPSFAEANKPQVKVTATVSVWSWRQNGPTGNYCWHRLSVGGDWLPVDLSETRVRRWARLSNRTWYATITLDGWER